jgi:hypothetical protein
MVGWRNRLSAVVTCDSRHFFIQNMPLDYALDSVFLPGFGFHTV